MYKIIMCSKRKAGITPEEFSQYWNEKHGPLAAKLMPEVRRYVQNHAVRLGSGEPRFDGIAEVWFDDMDSLNKFRKWYLSDNAKALKDDEANFVDPKSVFSFVAEERVIKP